MSWAAALALLPRAWAQDMVPVVSEQDLYLVFGSFAGAVAAIALYLCRDYIARRKTSYESGQYESQKNRDYEKYHSEWSDDSQAGGEAGQGAGQEERSGEDHYAVLGLKPTASAGQIKRRYRELAKEEHPDREGSDERMAAINRAYEALSEEHRRKSYGGES